ncbi:hypothetical protein KUCAC02_002487, partial [Chaenocephalus aceratus]
MRSKDDEDFGSIAVATETGADVTLVAGRLAGALIVTVMEMQLDGNIIFHLPCQWMDGSPGGTHSHQRRKLVFSSAPVKSSP